MNKLPFLCGQAYLPKAGCPRNWKDNTKKRVTFMPLFLEDIGRECFRGPGVNMPQVSDFEGSFCLLS